MKGAGIRLCTSVDLNAVHSIINDGALAYRGHVPPDCLHVPYMSLDELKSEIADGVGFWGCEQNGELVGVIGRQEVRDVVLIRHAYVRSVMRGRGIGGRLLKKLLAQCDRSVLVGTWKAASWAIGFYSRIGFREVDTTRKDLMLKRYWKVSERQIEESVVLANQFRWQKQTAHGEKATNMLDCNGAIYGPL